MILDILNINDNQRGDVSYKAELSEFDHIYEVLSREEYSIVKELSLKQIEEGFLDPRYIMYAIFGMWYESSSFDINRELLGNIEVIHQFFVEKIENGFIRANFYLGAVQWLHTKIYEHATFIKNEHVIFFDGDKNSFNTAFDEYILYLKDYFLDIDLTKVYQVKDIFNSFRVAESNYEYIEDCSVSTTETVNIENDQKLNYSENNASGSGLGEWDKLLKDINIYRDLVKEESWLKASVVYQVINSKLKNFDHVKYFPETFYPYLKDTANAYDHLMHYLSLSNHPLWAILSQMFLNDPDAFSKEDSLSGVAEKLKIHSIQSNENSDFEHNQNETVNDFYD
ncbi:hypothetical protein LA02_1235 [Francisella philomiragia]|uniref:type VI secretion system protein IglI family protein n=1 Tax=Francisella philomiragia TaxID=28110 RepID=UPI0005A5758C|nr:type VI secretion system protein IglI family protein [Francisella philomiragia]AJI56249.1 hypothetical protein LA02_1235 [Francisella philomiragia]